jgi:hypothetical protein
LLFGVGFAATTALLVRGVRANLSRARPAVPPPLSPGIAHRTSGAQDLFSLP